MKKITKSLLLSALIIGLSACSSETVLEMEKFQDDWYKDLQTATPNKYHLDKNIYLYMAYDRKRLIQDKSTTHGCSIRFYNLEKSTNFTSVEGALAYLNQVDTGSYPQWIASADGQNKYYMRGRQLIQSIWFKQSDMPDDIFNPFNLNIPEFYANSKSKDIITESPVKTAYDECLKFFYDGADKQTYTKKYHLNFLEKYRKSFFGEKYRKSDFEEVLKNRNALGRMDTGCHGASFYLLDINKRLFVTIDVGTKKIFPNPNCKQYL